MALLKGRFEAADCLAVDRADILTDVAPENPISDQRAKFPWDCAA